MEEKRNRTFKLTLWRKKSKLVVVHGRRRIGKTYLIDYMFQTHRKLFFFKFTGSADQDSNIQLDYFLEAIYSGSK